MARRANRRAFPEVRSRQWSRRGGCTSQSGQAKHKAGTVIPNNSNVNISALRDSDNPPIRCQRFRQDKLKKAAQVVRHFHQGRFRCQGGIPPAGSDFSGHSVRPDPQPPRWYATFHVGNSCCQGRLSPAGAAISRPSGRLDQWSIRGCAISPFTAGFPDVRWQSDFPASRTKPQFKS